MKKKDVALKNKANRTIIKNTKKKVLENPKINDQEFSKTVSIISKVGKKVYHSNKISRIISRLSKLRKKNE